MSANAAEDPVLDDSRSERGSPLVVDPRAVALLEMGGFHAHGEVMLAGRRIHFDQGDVVDVVGADGDVSLAAFLRDSERVPVDWLAQHEHPYDERRLDAELERAGLLTDGDLRAVRRSLWLERLAAALDDAQRANEALPRLGAPPPGMRQGRGARLVPLVLDALARLAVEDAAEDVGARLAHRLRWSASPHEEQARTWCGFGDAAPHPAVASILARRPAAAPRIAALVRAALVHLDPPGASILVPAPSGETLPPPLPRRSLVPTARPVGIVKPRLSLPPARPPRLRLDPGAAEVADEPLMPTALRGFPAPVASAEDPLWDLEREIAKLEDETAPGPARAAAFQRLGHLWRDRLRSHDEAARALREAAAADPTDAAILCETASACLAAGDARLALQVADVAVAVANTSGLRAAARRLRARLHATLGQADAHVEDLCEAIADEPTDLDSHERVADFLAARGDAPGANSHLRLAALGHAGTERGLALLRWAAELRPDHLATAHELAQALDATERVPAAVLAWLETARHQRVPAERRRLRFAAAEYAGARRRPDLAADALEEVLDDSPGHEALREPLDAALAAAGFTARRVALLEELAAAQTGAARAAALAAAAGALVEVDAERESALHLAHEALCAHPGMPVALALLREHAGSPSELAALALGLRGAATASASANADEAVILLEELALLADERLGDPGLAHWAWRQVADLGRGDRRVESAIERLGRRLAEGPAHDALAIVSDQGGESTAVAARLEQEVAEASDAEARRKALRRVATVHAARGDAKAIADACERLLTLDPRDALAAARAERAARRLGDQALLDRALEAQVPDASAPRAHARALVRWAAHREAVGDGAMAARIAAKALAADPTDARAAQIKLGHAELLSGSDGPGPLPQAHETLGSSRSWFRARARAAELADDWHARQSALSAWCEILPCDSEGARALLACELDGGTHEDARRAGARLLDIAPGREALAAVGDAVDRLLTRGANEDGLRLLVRVGQDLGRPGGSLAARAFELATVVQPDLAVEALEWAAAQPDAPARASALAALARLHRERADGLGESRALQRLLMVAPDRADAFERLEALWLATGARARLALLYALGAETADTTEVRMSHLRNLVAVTADDREQAAQHVRTLILEQASDSGELRSAAGLLFALGDKRWAIAQTETIAAACPPEAGGKLALWTVMTAEYVLVDAVLARELAMRAAPRFPHEAGLLLLVERLALAAGDVPGALATYDALLGAAIGPHGRRTLQYRAGRWLENAGRPREALARFLDAFALAPSMGVAYRAAERLAEAAGDHRALERLYATLAAATRDTALRFELTRRVGELLLDRLDEPERGFATLLEANALSESFALDDTLRERARAWLRQSSPIAAAALETLRRHWEERVENLWEARARIACLRKLAVLLTEDFGDAPAAFDYLDRATAIAKEEQVEDSVLADLERDLTALQARSQAGGGPPMERRSYAGTVASPRQSRVPGAPQATPAVSAQAREDPREAAQREPWRIDLWKQLALERFDAFPALGLVARALLSVVEGAAPGDDRRDFTRAWRGIALDTVIGPTYPDALGALLSQIWQRARVLPRFRFAIEQFGVSARDRLTRLSTGMVSDAYAEAAQTLGIHVAVYASDAADPPVRALPTYPTCLVTTPHLTGSPAERAYAVAHALWLTRGEHVISALLAEHEARLLLDAFIAAFGSGRSSGAADRERMELAAQFWQTIPARDQQVLAALVRAHAAQLDYPALRGAAHAAAARAGLCVSGDVAVALRATLADAGISTAPLDPARLETACGSSPAVAEVVRCALSREFLSATARAYGVA